MSTVKAGLVGLPNVGKSTLFNALTNSQVPAENYPFCTIDPHQAITEVPDDRLTDLATLYGSKKIIPSTMSFVDIAGLVKGASQGAGLGNQFLGHIKEVDLILHVVRCFESNNEPLNPEEDLSIIMSELALKDLEALEKRLQKMGPLYKAAQNKPLEKKNIEKEEVLIKSLIDSLNIENFAQLKSFIKESDVQTIPLLTQKKFLIIANFSEEDFIKELYTQNKYFEKLMLLYGAENIIPICAKIEYELAQLALEERLDFMNMLQIKKSGLEKIITKTYASLNLITFFTVGPKEAHAWPILKGKTVKQAAGQIHSDLEKGFICAEVCSYKDLIEYKSEALVKDKGKMRIEGQHYLIQDGDWLHIRFNV